MSVVTVWRSDVCHLPTTCHVPCTDLRINFFASECLLPYCLNSFVYIDMCMHVYLSLLLNEAREKWWFSDSYRMTLRCSRYVISVSWNGATRVECKWTVEHLDTAGVTECRIIWEEELEETGEKAVASCFKAKRLERKRSRRVLKQRDCRESGRVVF